MFRLLRKAQNIRERLGLSGATDEPIIFKPKGMHQKTFDRLRFEVERAEMRMNYALLQGLDFDFKKRADMNPGFDILREGGLRQYKPGEVIPYERLDEEVDDLGFYEVIRPRTEEMPVHKPKPRPLKPTGARLSGMQNGGKNISQLQHNLCCNRQKNILTPPEGMLFCFCLKPPPEATVMAIFLFAENITRSRSGQRQRPGGLWWTVSLPECFF